jgi:hypothetical protein
MVSTQPDRLEELLRLMLCDATAQTPKWPGYYALASAWAAIDRDPALSPEDAARAARDTRHLDDISHPHDRALTVVMIRVRLAVGASAEGVLMSSIRALAADFPAAAAMLRAQLAVQLLKG